MKKISIFVTVTLGMLTAFGPFITDFYLPFMPEMASYFATSPSAVAMSLTAGMVGLAVGQVLIGPLSDKYGRKKLLVGAMVLFSVASLLILFSPTIVVFNALRVVQGLASAVFGASTFVAGALVSPLVTMGDVVVSSALVIVAGAALCVVFTLPLCAAVKKEQMSRG